MSLELHYLPTPDAHRLCYATFGDGNDDLSKPAILFLHGGPGSSCQAGDAELFDPARYHLVMFDQRGCGLSTPGGDVLNNTTQHLLADIEQLRTHLGIERWSVYGGSWGATLALEYAKAQRGKVERLLLRGTFLARQQDLDWFIAPDGVAQELPQAYAELQAVLQSDAGIATGIDTATGTDTVTGQTLLATLYQRLLAAEQSAAQEERAYRAALAIGNWNAAIMRAPQTAAENSPTLRQARIWRERIFAHYCQHGFFLPPNGVLAGIETLSDLPMTLLHGRNDCVCPLTGAYTLCAHLPHAQLVTVEAGHGLNEKPLREALVAALL